MPFKKLYILSLIIFLFPSALFAETQDATVTTQSGSYSVPVEVEGGEVTYVHWPNGGDMTVSGAELQGGEADGINSRGDSVHIELDDSSAGDNE